MEAITRTALKKGDWLMIPPHKGPAVGEMVDIELRNPSEYHLYNLKEDKGQQKNLVKINPDKLQEMIEAYEAIRGKEYVETKQKTAINKNIYQMTLKKKVYQFLPTKTHFLRTGISFGKVHYLA